MRRGDSAGDLQVSCLCGPQRHPTIAAELGSRSRRSWSRPGEPAHVLALIDPESDLAQAVAETGRAVVQLLEWGHQQLAETFASRFPSPGEPFRTGEWVDTDWGPRLADAPTWAGVRVVDELRPVGWYTLVDAVIEHVEVGGETTPLVHRRGSYERGS